MFANCKPMSPELTALLERAKSHVMTPRERFEQRASFVWGMLSHDDKRTKDDVRRWLAEQEGREEWL
jgi:hypothetical protein